MNSKIIFVLLLSLLSFNSFGQGGGGVEEAKPLTAEQKRIYEVDAKIRAIRKEIKKPLGEFGDLMTQSSGIGNNDTKALYTDRILKSEKALFFAQEAGLLEKLEQINQLRKSINNYKVDATQSVRGSIKKLNSNIVGANEKLKNIRTEKGKDNTNNIKLSIMDDELSKLDNLLENDKKSVDIYNKTNKSQSLDDFLASTTKTTSNNNDFLADINTSNSKSDDFLAEDNSDSKDFLNSTKEDKSHKIDYKNNLQGVISNNGKLLIPYKNWTIVEYKIGIAKVRKHIDSYKCSAWIDKVDVPVVSAYKEGFVDGRGEFIDGYKVAFNHGKLNTLYLTRTTTNEPPFSSNAEATAYRRNVARKKALARKQRAIRGKKCEIQENQWKNSMISKYQ